MKSPRLLHLQHLLSLILCCVLLASSLIPTSVGKTTSPALGQRSSSNTQSGRGRKVRAEAAQPGAPAAAVPNLDDVRQLPQLIAQTPSPIVSTERSRRKPLVSRGGRRVGDPLPTPTATPLPTATPTPLPSPPPLPSPVPSPTVLPSPPMPVMQGKRTESSKQQLI